MGIALRSILEYPAERERASPNWSARPANVDAIEMLLVHGTEDGGNEAACLDWLCDPASKVSAHLLLHRDGSLTRLVADRRKAWHAGVSDWRLYPSERWVSDLNRLALGIEVCNRCDGREPYTEAQYVTLSQVVAHYCRQGLAMQNVTGHEDVAPHRKRDPGPLFEWPRLRLDALRLLFPAPLPDEDHARDVRRPRPAVPPFLTPTRRSA